MAKAPRLGPHPVGMIGRRIVARWVGDEGLTRFGEASLAERRRVGVPRQLRMGGTVERFTWYPRLRRAVMAKPLVVASVTVVALTVMVAVGVAATSQTSNGCPKDKST